MQEDNTSISSTTLSGDGNQGYSDGGSMGNPAAQAAPDLKSSTIVEPDVLFSTGKKDNGKKQTTSKSIYAELDDKIKASKNILIALSSDPSVDEMAAAIGLSLYLDKLGKRATAIYSGATPNALEFLKPEETFESTADALQDFVIAINKEKADHLRYKLDGEFVKIYITPYRARISEDDLEFSYGDFNVDLVLALDVANGIDLDSALREHGRIMHDAVIVNISTSSPGKFGEIEWSDKAASSVSEMIAKLLYNIKNDVEVGKEEATAFLTGIVAATNRFSNASTTPETMQVAGRLMKSGANQQLVSRNITPDVENEVISLDTDLDEDVATNDSDEEDTVDAPSKPIDSTKLSIEHNGEKIADENKKEVDTDVAERESTLLDDLKAAEASLAMAGAETIENPDENPVKIDISKKKDNLTTATQGASESLADDFDKNTEEESGKTADDMLNDEPTNKADDFVENAEDLNTPEEEQVVYGTDNSISMEDPEIFNMNKADVVAEDSDNAKEDVSVEGLNDAKEEPVANTTELVAEEPVAVAEEPVVVAREPEEKALPDITEEPEEKVLPDVAGEPAVTIKEPKEEMLPNVAEKLGANATGAVTPETVTAEEPVVGEVNASGAAGAVEEPVTTSAMDAAMNPTTAGEEANSEGYAFESDRGEKVINPEAGFESELESGFAEDKYGHMLEDALNNANSFGGNIAAAGAPNVPSVPEINGVPEMNYASVPSEGVLPPPPMPPVNMNGNALSPQGQLPQAPQFNGSANSPVLPGVEPIMPAIPPSEPTLTSLGSQPAMQDQVYGAQANDPSAFRIPGM